MSRDSQTLELKCKPLCHQNNHVDCDLDVLFSSKQKYLSDKSKANTLPFKKTRKKLIL